MASSSKARRRPDPALALPRRVETTLLHRTLRMELETFIEEAARTERHLPRFVERELRAFVDCGIAANGFVRVHCSSCGHDRLVPLTCRSHCTSPAHPVVTGIGPD